MPEDDAKAAAWYEKAAEQGDADAQYLLGRMYHNGEGVPVDMCRAVAWFRKAAEQGLADAQYLFGLLHHVGWWVVQEDKATAATWFIKAAEQYKKAAEQGDGKARSQLNIIYLIVGQTLPGDVVPKVAAWFAEKAAEQGDLTAYSNLMKLLRTRGGVFD